MPGETIGGSIAEFNSQSGSLEDDRYAGNGPRCHLVASPGTSNSRRTKVVPRW